MKASRVSSASSMLRASRASNADADGEGSVGYGYVYNHDKGEDEGYGEWPCAGNRHLPLSLLRSFPFANNSCPHAPRFNTTSILSHCQHTGSSSLRSCKSPSSTYPLKHLSSHVRTMARMRPQLCGMRPYPNCLVCTYMRRSSGSLFLDKLVTGLTPDTSNYGTRPTWPNLVADVLSALVGVLGIPGRSHLHLLCVVVLRHMAPLPYPSRSCL